MNKFIPHIIVYVITYPCMSINGAMGGLIIVPPKDLNLFSNCIFGFFIHYIKGKDIFTTIEFNEDDSRYVRHPSSLYKEEVFTANKPYPLEIYVYRYDIIRKLLYFTYFHVL